MCGHSLDLLVNPNIDKRFICCICVKVIRKPTMSASCGRVFCKICIEHWMSRSSSSMCPVGRHPTSELRLPLLEYMKLYRDIKLKCGFNGCHTISTLGEIEGHYVECYYNPEAYKQCVHNCGAYIKMKEISTHKCVEYLKMKMRKRLVELTISHKMKMKRRKAEHIKELTTQVNSRIRDITTLNKIIAQKNSEIQALKLNEFVNRKRDKMMNDFISKCQELREEQRRNKEKQKKGKGMVRRELGQMGTTFSLLKNEAKRAIRKSPRLKNKSAPMYAESNIIEDTF